ncbi:MAG TPA: PAS domain-containing protein [Albitalea sp.]|uniref:PAS domain-containing protein n=1 Tax=Piscinibacter sp. TaxID=1903157 RepID=UPI002ED15AB9
MTARVRFVLWLALLCGVAAVLVVLGGWVLWASPVQDRLALVVGLALLLPLLLAGLLQAWMRAWPLAAARMALDVARIQTVDPTHRVSLAGAADLRQLGDAVNAFAQAQARLLSQVDARVASAGQRLDEERNRLDALMSQLAHSVLVCERGGRIQLVNARAARLLGDDPPEPGGSVFGLIERSQIEDALDRIGRRLEQEEPHPVVSFVTARGDRLLRVQMAPVLDAGGEIGGFVLTLDDITRSVESDNRRERLLRQLTEGTRAGLANIRAAAETVQQYPDMDADQRERFTAVILDEAERLSARLDAAAAADPAVPATPWPLEDMLAADFAYALQRHIERRLHVTVGRQGGDEPVWLSVDSHALLHGLTHLAGRIVAASGSRSVMLEVTAAGRFLRLSLCWAGTALEPDTLRDWEDEPIAMPSGEPGPALAELLARHGAEMWSQADRAAGRHRVCIQLPVARREMAAGSNAGRT